MAIDFKTYVRKGVPELAVVAQRFPYAVLAAMASTLYFLLDMHKQEAWPLEIRAYRVPAALAAAFLWSFAATLHAEAKGLEPRVQRALVLAGWLVIWLLAVLATAIDLNFPMLIAALTLAVGLAAYVVPPPRNAAFWLFNHNLWFAWLAAGIVLLLSAGGITAILETLRYLFGLAIPFEIHEKIWVVAGFLVAPVYWLSHTPRTFETAVAEEEPTELVSRLIAAMVKYILVPLLLAYAVILHVYAVKILIDGSLPKGRLGWLVLTFGCVLAITAMVAYPSRAAGGRMVALFWRFWPWVLVVPLGLLFLAVGVRIREYGLTEPRYLVAMAGVWLASLVITQGLRRERDLRLIPGVLMGLLAFASLGPWGASGWPIRNQLREFNARLEAAGMLQNGQVPADARPATTLLASDKQRLHGIIDYLDRSGRLDMLRPLFQGASKDPFEGRRPGEARRHDVALADTIRERLKIGPRYSAYGVRQNRSYHVSKPAALPIGSGGQHHVVGPFSFYSSPTSRPGSQVVATPGGSLTITFEKNSLSARDAGGREAVFDLNKLAEGDGLLSIAKPQAANAGPLSIQRTSGDLPADLMLIGINGNFGDDDAVRINNIQFWLLLGK